MGVVPSGAPPRMGFLGGNLGRQPLALVQFVAVRDKGKGGLASSPEPTPRHRPPTAARPLTTAAAVSWPETQWQSASCSESCPPTAAIHSARGCQLRAGRLGPQPHHMPKARATLWASSRSRATLDVLHDPQPGATGPAMQAPPLNQEDALHNIHSEGSVVVHWCSSSPIRTRTNSCPA